MAQKLAPNFSFKHGRPQSAKFPYRPVGWGTPTNDFYMEKSELIRKL
jgi:hypothetical protein